MGGLVGKTATTQLNISDSYYNGGITAPNKTIGGIVGKVVSGTQTTTNVYYKGIATSATSVGENMQHQC